MAYEDLLRRIAHFQVERPVLTVLLIAAATLMIYGGVSEVRTVTSLEQMMPRGIEEIRAFNTLRDNGMGQDLLGIVLTIDRESVSNREGVESEDVARYVERVESLLRDEPDVLATYSYLSAPFKDSFIDKDGTTTYVLASTDVAANDERMKSLAERVRSIAMDAGIPLGVRVSFTGTPLIQQRLGELIAKDRKDTQVIATVLVFLLILLTFNTFSSALVPIIIVTISVNWLYGTMGYTGLPISTLAGGVAAMVIGIGIDFAIHIMNKFKYERKRGKSVKEAVELAVVETGTALTATSATTVAAFLAFLAGKMPEMGRFGTLMAIGIGYSLLFSVFGLPAMLVLEEKAIYYLKKKLRFGVEGELRLVSEQETCTAEGGK